MLEATNGGILQVNGVTVNNAGANITANSGSTVQLFDGTVIQGGTLNNIGGTLGTPANYTATLDGSTQGPLTINGTYTSDLNTQTTLLGTINNKDNFQLNGGSGTNSELFIGNNVTLQGGGTVTLSTTASASGGTAFIEQNGSSLTLTNVNNTIQGAGVIGNNGLTLINQATINANSSGQTLALEGISGVLSNTGLLEATNGGILQVNGVTVNNAGANITANSGSTVQLYGGTVIQGGTLNNNGGTLGTLASNAATLDGSTGAGRGDHQRHLYERLEYPDHPPGDDQQQQQLPVERGEWHQFGTVHRQQCDAARRGHGDAVHRRIRSGGAAFIEQNGSSLTLTNVNNTIQGAGVIGNNGLTLINQATINANSSGQTLLLQSMAEGLTNTGLLEATNGGILQVNGVAVNNAGANITANSGSTVQLYGGTVIQGGTLNNNGGTLGTLAGNAATLDGTHARRVDHQRHLYERLEYPDHPPGTINNNNNFQLNGGSGTNSELFIGNNVTLQGGGTVTLSTTAAGGGNAFIEQNGSSLTLTNVNNTIQGDGIIGNNGLSLVNQAGGTINANSTGGP